MRTRPSPCSLENKSARERCGFGNVSADLFASCARVASRALFTSARTGGRGGAQATGAERESTCSESIRSPSRIAANVGHSSNGSNSATRTSLTSSKEASLPSRFTSPKQPDYAAEAGHFDIELHSESKAK